MEKLSRFAEGLAFKTSKVLHANRHLAHLLGCWNIILKQAEHHQIGLVIQRANVLIISQ
jgi:hypothetical protein